MRHKNPYRHISPYVFFGLMVTAVAAELAEAQVPRFRRTSRDRCTPIFQSDLPVTITEPGTYCLGQNMAYASASGAAITIAASDVVLDLNEKFLDNGDSGAATQAIGVLAEDRKNITIKRGTIRGFLFGINFRDTGASSGHLARELLVEGSRQIGIFLQGAGNVVRQNRVLNTGGSTNPDLGIGGIGVAVGILVDGTEARVIDNEVAKVSPTGAPGGEGVGIAQQWGFASPGMPPSADAFFVGNRISDVFYGLIGGRDASSTPTAKCRDNLLMGAQNDFNLCIDAGGNN